MTFTVDRMTQKFHPKYDEGVFVGFLRGGLVVQYQHPYDVFQTLQALIEAKASLQLADRSGRTPLTLARERGYSAMVRMLEAAGAR